MLARLRMIWRSFIGFFISSAENPKLILEQLKRDYHDKLPQMRSNLANVIKAQELLKLQKAEMQQEIERMKPAIEAAVKAGPAKRQIAESMIANLQGKEQELKEIEAQLLEATNEVDLAKKAATAFELKVQEQMQKCDRLISKSERAKMKQEMASMMGSFKVGDESDTLDRMNTKIDEQLALAEAQTQVAANNVESQMAEIQSDAAALTASAAYDEYAKQLGLTVEETPAEKTMDTVTPPVQTTSQ